MELKKKYKYRLILDESQSVGMVGAHGRGVTEHYGILVSEFGTQMYWVLIWYQASEVDMLVGSMANGFAAGGGFCAGSRVVCSHQVRNPA